MLHVLPSWGAVGKARLEQKVGMEEGLAESLNGDIEVHVEAS